MKLKKKHTYHYAFCFIFFCSFSAHAETLRLCSTAAWPPYEFTNPETKQVSGISVEIVKKIAANLSMNVEISPLPWERCLKMNETGDMDGVFSVSKKPEREAYLLYPQHEIQNVSYVLATLKNTKTSWDASKNISGIPQPIGSPQGFSVTQSLKDLKTIAVDDSATSDEVNVKKLMNGRLGSIAIGPEVLKNILKDNPDRDQIITLSPPYQDSKQYFVAISKKYKGNPKLAEDLCKKIDTALEDIHKNTR